MELLQNQEKAIEWDEKLGDYLDTCLAAAADEAEKRAVLMAANVAILRRFRDHAPADPKQLDEGERGLRSLPGLRHDAHRR